MNFKPLPDDVTKVKTPAGNVRRIIVCAANMLEDGTIICGARHWDGIMSKIADKIGIDERAKIDQGFIDQWGNFVTREDARLIVEMNGQKTRFDDFCDFYRLYSEDLY